MQGKLINQDVTKELFMDVFVSEHPDKRTRACSPYKSNRDRKCMKMLRAPWRDTRSAHMEQLGGILE